MAELSSFEKNVLRRASVGDMLVRTAARFPDKVALKFRDKSYTFREFNSVVNKCAYGLSMLGIKKGDRAAILSHNCDQFLIYWWALMKLGAIITPLNFMLKGQEVKYIINHSEASMFVVEDSLIGNMIDVKDELKSVKHFCYINLTGSEVPEGWINIEDLWKDEYPYVEPEVEIYYDDPATLLYTSGTEAAPKGVLNSHLNFYMDVLSSLYDLRVGPDDRIIAGIPLFHVAAMYLFVALVAGGAYSVLEYVPDPAEILRFTQDEKITVWVWPPALYTGLPFMPDFDKYDISSLRLCIIFGSLAPSSVIEKWKNMLPEAGFMNYYGQTELSPLGASLLPEDFDKKPTSIGKPHMPLQMKVFDPDDNELPPGEVGELVARGPAVMLGYYKEEEKTAQTFRKGWHHTGDIVRMDEDGFIYFVDRRKDIIKSGGENVSSQEVEAVLFKHPAIADAAVIGLPDPYWSEAVTAIVVPAPGQEINEEDIITFCKKELAGYKVPKKVIKIDALPRNPSGKILKNELRNRFAEKG
ncbi:MAG: AMP-binding protein [Deltaproteobacteria bacterium]|nr:AMP-binding protein [Deltaproteobacteria bacterium]